MASLLVLFGAFVASFSVAMTAAGAANDAVAIQNFAYVPADITVHIGDSVTWTNKDSSPHTVTADDGSFSSDDNRTPCTSELVTAGCMNQNQTYTHTFTTSVAYHCKLHANMHGNVFVLAPTTTTRAVVTTTRAGATTTRPGAPTTTASGGVTTTSSLAGGPIVFPDDTSTSTPTGQAVAKTKDGGGGSSGAVVAIVAALGAVAIGGGALLWRLRPRP